MFEVTTKDLDEKVTLEGIFEETFIGLGGNAIIDKGISGRLEAAAINICR